MVVSTNALNRGHSGLLFVLPLTRTDRFNPLHIPIEPSEGGVQSRSFILCDVLRSISTARLGPRPWGRVSTRTMTEVEDRLRILLDL
jgi:mRNA interferase MazF